MGDLSRTNHKRQPNKPTGKACAANRTPFAARPAADLGNRPLADVRREEWGAVVTAVSRVRSAGLTLFGGQLIVKRAWTRCTRAREGGWRSGRMAVARLDARGIRVACGVVLLTLWAVNPAWSAADSIDSLRRKAERLESENRWLEAGDTYRQLAIRQPGVAAWGTRRRECLEQAQLTRRCRDPRFRQRIRELPFPAASQLYREVLDKIATYYVDGLHLDRLLAAGVRQLDLGSRNRAFLETALGEVPSQVPVLSLQHLVRSRWSGLTADTPEQAVSQMRALAMAVQQETGIPPTVVAVEFVYAACAALDEYSSYLNPDRYALERAATERRADIGLQLQVVHGQMVVGRVVPGGPAARAGILPNDRVLAIDGVPTDRLGVEEAALRLRGEAGSSVILSLQGGMGEPPRTVSISRQRIQLASVIDAQIVDSEWLIGYIHLTFFQESTPRELDAAIDQLIQQGMRGLILDLRGNPGGSFEAAIQVADRFIASGVLVSARGASLDQPRIYQAQSQDDVKLPLVILIDHETACAGEVVAGAIKGQHRGVIVGEKSFGKGCLQHLFGLRTVPAGVRLTTARLFAPPDSPISGSGVVPDIIVDRLPGMDDVPRSLMTLMELQQMQFEVAVQAVRDLIRRE